MKANWIKNLQKRWGLTSVYQVIVVLIVFACTGFSVLYIKKPVLSFLGADQLSSGIIKFILNLLIILPIYQVVLLAYGFIFGQFKFFWEFEKKMFRRMGKIFQR